MVNIQDHKNNNDQAGMKSYRLEKKPAMAVFGYAEFFYKLAGRV